MTSEGPRDCFGPTRGNNFPSLLGQSNLHIRDRATIDATIPAARKRTLEVIEDLETSASLTTHAGILLVSKGS